MDKYHVLHPIGEGSFGKVYKAKIGDDLFALKKIKVDSPDKGFPITSIREIKVLKKLADHPNIVKLVDIVSSKSNAVYLVFEFVEFDLFKLLRKENVAFTKPQIKFIFKQIMEGLVFMHKKRIIHRDIKSENILINAKGELKYADFGLARDLMQDLQGQKGERIPAHYTKKVVTQFYRPPEVCLEDPCYNEKVDVWSAGCVLAELISRRPIFPGTSELD